MDHTLLALIGIATPFAVSWILSRCRGAEAMTERAAGRPALRHYDDDPRD
jgi:hypothetical protein